MRCEEDPNYEFLCPKRRRFSPLPAEHPDLMALADDMRDNLWSPHVGNFADDRAGYEKLAKKHPATANAYINLVGYLTGVESLIMRNVQDVGVDIDLPEVRQWCAFQGANEAVHWQAYAMAANVYMQNVVDQDKIYRAMEELPSVKAKGEWTQNWMNRSRTFAQRIIAQTCIEGIHLSGSFVIIVVLESVFPGLLKGFYTINEWVRADEARHANFYAALHSKLPYHCDMAETAEIVNSALQAELKFLEEIMPEGIVGMSLESACEHARYMANYWFTRLHPDQGNLVFNPNGSVPQPRPEFNKVTGLVKAAFFERDPVYPNGPPVKQTASLKEYF